MLLTYGGKLFDKLVVDDGAECHVSHPRLHPLVVSYEKVIELTLAYLLGLGRLLDLLLLLLHHLSRTRVLSEA